MRSPQTAAALLLLVLAPACVFYEAQDDDVPPAPPDAWRSSPDAWRDVDAMPPDAMPADTSACSVTLSCPAAAAGRTTVCGRFYDVENDAQIRAVTQSTGLCEPNGASGGACNLAVRFYDFVELAEDPIAAVPLLSDQLQLDDCGRFVARNVALPASGVIAIAVDDAQGAPDVRRLSVRARGVSTGQVLRNERAYSIRRATDEGWTATAGLTGSTLVDRGVLWTMFRRGNTPVAGVQVTGAGSAVRPADDYYFSDIGPFNRISIEAALTATGANGSALMVNSSMVMHSGTGAERATCTWSSTLAASIPGVLVVAPSSLQTATGQACP